MSSSKGIRAGRAFVEVFADTGELTRGLRLAQKKITAFGQQVRTLGLRIAGMGSAILVPLAGAAKLFSSYGDQVAKMAKRTGLSVKTLSELRFVASQTGTEFSSLEMAFRKMQRSVYDAGRGLSTQTDALRDLGLTFKDLDGLSPENQFKLLADRIGRVEDPTRRAAIAMSLFGRTGTNLLPMFTQGAAGIEALQKQARQLGLTMRTEDAHAAEVFTDALDALWKVLRMGVFHVGAGLAPALTQLADTIRTVTQSTSQWIQSNRQIVVTVAALAAGLIVGGVALMAFGTILKLLAPVLTVVSSSIKALGLLFGALTSPVTLAIAAVVGIVAALVGASGQFKSFGQFVTKAMDFVREAIVTACSIGSFVFKNWRTVLEYAAVGAAYQIVKFAGEVKNFFTTVIPAVLQWFGQHWQEIFTTAWNFLKMFVSNIGK